MTKYYSFNLDVMVRAPLAHIVNDSVIGNVCTKSLATDVGQAKKEGKGKKIVIFFLLRMSYYLRPADVLKSLCVGYGPRAKGKRQATLRGRKAETVKL